MPPESQSAHPQPAPRPAPKPVGATAALALADGTVMWGKGMGAPGTTVGEVCFNTSMTGYQEILTDPSYAGQIINFTFPHIGNVGANAEDIETVTPAARGLVLRRDITEPSNWRSDQHLDAWLRSHNLTGISGIDTRALTRRIRDGGAPSGAIGFAPPDGKGDGDVDLTALLAAAGAFPGLEGMDLAAEVTCRQAYEWDEAGWVLGEGYSKLAATKFKVVAIDYGAKRNILRCLADSGCAVTVVPADTSAEDIVARQPDGVFLSNGPGDPAATGQYAVPIIQKLIAAGVPLFGICLGHQLLARALGATTGKMHLGHRGANHPVKDLATGKVEITSQNHGFVVERDSLPDGVTETHHSLFDGSLEGIRAEGRKAFSVQYHPEASPGPRDSHYLFTRFVEMMAG
jgi:carbamoyl-phosphate synthase small subunit